MYVTGEFNIVVPAKPRNAANTTSYGSLLVLSGDACGEPDLRKQIIEVDVWRGQEVIDPIISVVRDSDPDISLFFKGGSDAKEFFGRVTSLEFDEQGMHLRALGDMSGAYNSITSDASDISFQLVIGTVPVKAGSTEFWMGEPTTRTIPALELYGWNTPVIQEETRILSPSTMIVEYIEYLKARMVEYPVDTWHPSWPGNQTPLTSDHGGRDYMGTVMKALRQKHYCTCHGDVA